MGMSIRRLGSFLALTCAVVSAGFKRPVGPTTHLRSKRANVCNVLDYGGTLNSSDIGPAIGTAFASCVLGHPGSTLYVPEGNYNMSTWQTLRNATQWALQMDGIITRTGNAGGHMIIIQDADDFEMFSKNSAGAFQGHGYLSRNAGPRFLRVVTSTNWSVHDLIFVDSPEFHIVVQGGSNGELYNLAIRGANIGGSDGIDIWGDNHWVHDVEVTNRDECVTVKSPASNFLIERIWCNQSGGSAIGSLANGTAIENIEYRNVYTNGGNQLMMIKSNGGNGYVRNVLFKNFIGRGTAYGLNVNQLWDRQTPAGGPGVQLSDITFEKWDGTIAYGLVNGLQRPPIQFICADGAPCVDMKLKHVNLWAETGNGTYKCESAYGSGGACLQKEPKGDSGSDSDDPPTATATLQSYPVTTVVADKPADFTEPPSLDGDLAVGFATDAPIPIPTIPTMYYPGLPQISELASKKYKHKHWI